MDARRVQRAVWALGAVVVFVAPIVYAPIAVANGEPRGAVLASTVVLLLLGVVAAFVASRRPRNPVSWLLLVLAGAQPVGMVATQLLQVGAKRDWAEGTLEWLGWLSGTSWVLTLPLIPLLLLLFPHGRPRSRRWRPWVVVAGGAVGLLLLGGFAPGPMPGLDSPVPLENPTGVPGLGVLAPLSFAALIGLLPAGIAGVVSVAAYGLRGDPDERAQVRWVALAAALALVALLAAIPTPDGSFVETVALLLLLGGVPAAMGAAVIGHRLYDVDLVIHRTSVYTVVAGALLVVHAAVAWAAGRLGVAHGDVAGLLGTAVVAVAFAPVRDRVRLAVDRHLYGDRRDPVRALVAVTARASGIGTDTEADLSTLAATVADALRSPFVAIVTTAGETGRSGEARDGDPIVRSLVHGGVEVGTLTIAPRSPGGGLSADDDRLLRLLTNQTALVVHGLTTSAELRRSRGALLTAVEEERRRLRRDLHDDLGPALAGVALGLETIEDSLRHDVDAAALAVRLRTATRGAVDDVRRLVYDLRPPSLDELGLVGALQARLASAGTLAVELEADPLPSLPAAVEVAAYRIALEAVANAARHAGAGRCLVRLACQPGGLALDVADDGKGLLPGWTPGVGLRSMQERASELGGTFGVGARDDGTGTHVRVWLPVPAW